MGVQTSCCCSNSRGKDRLQVQLLLTNSAKSGDLGDLRSAIREAEACGVDTILARQKFAELARQERQSPESAREMLRWAMSTRDGVILQSVLLEVASATPSPPELPAANARLLELQSETKQHLLRMSKTDDAKSMQVLLERARRMGVPPDELRDAEGALREMRASPAQRRASRRRPSDRRRQPVAMQTRRL